MRRIPLTMLVALIASLGTHVLAFGLCRFLRSDERMSDRGGRASISNAVTIEFEPVQRAPSFIERAARHAESKRSENSPEVFEDPPLRSPQSRGRARSSREKASVKTDRSLPQTVSKSRDRGSTAPMPPLRSSIGHQAWDDLSETSALPTTADTPHLKEELAAAPYAADLSTTEERAETDVNASGAIHNAIDTPDATSISSNPNDGLLRAITHRLNAAAQPCYPRSAQRQGREGVITMRFCIDETGAPNDIALVQSSGIAQLDMAARCVIDRAAPFPVLPKHCLTVPIRFTLRHP